MHQGSSLSFLILILWIGGKLSFTTPLPIMFFGIAFCYVWPIAEKLSSDRGWWRGLFVAFSALNTFILLILRFIGVMPIPLDVSLPRQLDVQPAS
jgi:hypothetical protein